MIFDIPEISESPFIHKLSMYGPWIQIRYIWEINIVYLNFGLPKHFERWLWDVSVTLGHQNGCLIFLPPKSIDLELVSPLDSFDFAV